MWLEVPTPILSTQRHLANPRISATLPIVTMLGVDGILFVEAAPFVTYNII